MNGRCLFLLVFVGLGMWAVIQGSVKAVEGLNSYSWSTASGRVILSRIEEMQTSQKIRIARLYLRIDYLYKVGDSVYEGHRINTGWQFFGSENKVKALAERYASGKAVQVKYDPANPQRSVLEPGLDWSVYFLWGIGVTMLSAALPLYRKARSSTR